MTRKILTFSGILMAFLILCKFRKNSDFWSISLSLEYKNDEHFLTFLQFFVIVIIIIFCSFCVIDYVKSN